MRRVPSFSLYGEGERPFPGDWLHCESIPARSGRHDWEIRPHRHPRFFQILHLTGGSGEAEAEDWRAPLAPVSAVTVPAGVPHGFHFSPDVQGSVLTIVEDKVAEALQGQPELAAAYERPQVIRLGDVQTVDAAGGAIRLIEAELTERRAGRDALIGAQLTSLLVLLGRELAATPTGADAGAATERHAQAFRALLARHFRTERSVGFYASALSVSETHLNRISRAALGRSALGAIHDRVLAEASRDLAFTSLSIQAIGRSLGFDDAAYFSRFFAKAAGLSPKAFRRAVAAGDGLRHGSLDQGAGFS